MTTKELVTQEQETHSPDQHNIQWLRNQMLQRIVVAGVVLGTLWYGYLVLVLNSTDLMVWRAPYTLVTFCLLSYWSVSHGGFRLAVCLYIIGVTLTSLFAALTSSDTSLLFFVALAPGIAGLLLSPGAGFFTAGLVGVTMAAAASSRLALVTPRLAEMVTIYSVLIALLLWVAMYPLRTALHWAWSGYERAQRKVEEAQEHRAHLARTLRDFETANQQLQSMAQELDRARRAANEARRLKAEFAANISHELRTPLNLIIGFSEMMTLAPHTYGNIPLPAAYRGDLQAIYRSAKHLSTLIEDVLDLSQIEAGRMGLAKESLSIATVVEEAIDTVVLLYESKGLWLNTQIPADLPLVEADRTRIRQVLINLLNNAVRFTSQGGVTIAATSNEHEVTVTVTDTGEGISDQDLPRIFQEFSQIDQSIRRLHEGSGLGLAISKKFVELHGGHMGVRSKKGEGTTFSFSLPRREDMGIRWSPPGWETWVRVMTGQQNRKKVAVLANDPATARFFERYLDNYQIIAIDDEKDAWRLSSEVGFQALLLVVPSGEEGWLTLRRARERLPNIPVLVCTLQGGVSASRPAGVTAYLVKPVSQAQFLETLAGLGEHVGSLLIVDDDPEIVRLLSRMVKSAPRPYCVRKAYSGEQALALLHSQPPDALILDLLMPEVDGYTVIEHMRRDERLRTVPIVIVTAKGVEEDIITAGLIGVTRRGGFSVGDTMRSLKASLDALSLSTPTDTASVLPAASAGRQASQ